MTTDQLHVATDVNTLLEDMIESVERIKRDYPDVPVRFEFSQDVWDRLVDACKVRHDFVSNVLTGKVFPPGITCVVNPTYGPGEWARYSGLPCPTFTR